MPALADQPVKIPAGYRVETIATPPGVDFEVGGIAFRRDGSMLVCTRFGDIWRRHNGNWTLFAEGLHESVGIYVDKKTDEVYVTQRPELTRLVDQDGDGRVDRYETVTADWGFSGNYHEYAFGPVRDRRGNFYVTLNLSHSERGRVRESVMGKNAPWRGWCVRVTPQGKMEPFASGMRSPSGLGMSPDDEIFYTDNQGDFNATSGLYHIQQGHFYGHPNALEDDPHFAGRDLSAIPLEELDKMRTRPAVWIPYGELANSPGEPIFDTTDGKFGPFAGQVFVGDQTKSNLMRMSLEKVDGQYQGAVFNFISHFDSGVIRNAFAGDGSLYVGQTDRGWGAIGGKRFALQRVIFDGKTVPFEMHSISLTNDGFDVRFTKPVDPATASQADRYLIQHWAYIYRAEYGGPKADLTLTAPKSITISSDRKVVHIGLPKLEPRRVYQVTPIGLKSAQGDPLTNDTGYYTLNRLREP